MSQRPGTTLGGPVCPEDGARGPDRHQHPRQRAQAQNQQHAPQSAQ